MKKIILILGIVLTFSSVFANSSETKKGNDGVSSETNTVPNIMIYPKLTEGIIYIDGLNTNSSLTLIKANGEQEAIKVQQIKGYNIIDLSNYQNGVYTIKITQNENNISTTIVKH